MTAVSVARPRIARNFRFEFQTATRLRSRAAARGELLVCLPCCEGKRSAERRTVTGRGLVPGSPGNRAHGNASRRSTCGDFFDLGTCLPGRGEAFAMIPRAFALSLQPRPAT